MRIHRFISEALEQPSQALFYQVSQRLAEMDPDRAIIEGNDYSFSLLNYVREGLCTIRVKDGVHPHVNVYWSPDDGIREMPKNVWYEVDWRGHALEVLLIDTPELPIYHWIIADTERVALDFFRAVCEHDPEYSDEVLVFDGGRFEASTGMFRGLKEAGYDELVLAGRLEARIRDDLERFFDGRQLYESLGVPWKRGLLLTGPPGNGKTHTIKALIGLLARPCLYVKSLKSECWTEETAIRRIFDRARVLAPCLIVLEDLDALVTAENRSFLLNELDGFARNTGLVVLATTNHPDRLDPALVERPSRFDRKYHFPLPGPDERLRFCLRWRDRLPESSRPSPAALELAAETTDGFSFAYLKELFLATSLLAAASEPGASMDDLLLEQVEILRQQIRPTA